METHGICGNSIVTVTFSLVLKGIIITVFFVCIETAALTVLLIQVIPMLFNPVNEGTDSSSANVVYRLTRQTNEEEILSRNHIKYKKEYTEKVEVLKVNDVDSEDAVDSQITEDFKAENIGLMCDKEMQIFPEGFVPEILKQQEGIRVNNRYQNMIDYKKGDILKISINGSIITCPIEKTYVDTNNVNTIGIATEAYMEQQGYQPNKDGAVSYALKGQVDNKILLQLLEKDGMAYIDKNQQMGEYLKKYIDNQKAVLMNNIIVVGFSSILLVFLAQMMQFILSMESTASRYHVSVLVLLTELVIVLAINLCSVLLPIHDFNYRKRK